MTKEKPLSEKVHHVAGGLAIHPEDVGLAVKRLKEAISNWTGAYSKEITNEMIDEIFGEFEEEKDYGAKEQIREDKPNGKPLDIIGSFE